MGSKSAGVTPSRANLSALKTHTILCVVSMQDGQPGGRDSRIFAPARVSGGPPVSPFPFLPSPLLSPLPPSSLLPLLSPLFLRPPPLPPSLLPSAPWLPLSPLSTLHSPRSPRSSLPSLHSSLPSLYFPLYPAQLSAFTPLLIRSFPPWHLRVTSVEDQQMRTGPHVQVEITQKI